MTQPAGLRNNFQDHMRLLKQYLKSHGGFMNAATSSLQMVSVRNFRAEEERVIIFTLLHKKLPVLKTIFKPNSS